MDGLERPTVRPNMEEVVDEDEDELDRFVSSGAQSQNFPTQYVLDCFGRTRRGAVVNGLIQRWLDKHDLEMRPAIAEADYYGEVHIRRIARSEPGSPEVPTDVASTIITALFPGVNSWVLSSLKDDAEELDFLEYGASVDAAVDMMKEKGRTKLPLFFSKEDRATLIGTVTLTDLTFDVADSKSKLVEKAATQVPVIGTNEKLFDWIPAILSYGFVYGKDHDGQIVQIYTVHDVATHLNTIAAMFLRANEIEELIRSVLVKIDEHELTRARQGVRSLGEIDLDGAGKTLQREEISPSGIADGDQRLVDSLTFADYMKCIADPQIWEQHFASLDIAVMDKERCLRSLNDARLARNEVMHFGRSDSLGTLIPSFEALAVWLRKLSSAAPTAR